MKRLLPVLLILVYSCQSNQRDDVGYSSGYATESNDTAVKTSPLESPDKITYRLLYKENSGWGYQVFSGAKMLINQEHIPAVQGIKGFDTREQAEKTVLHLIERMKNGDPRPTLSVEELDSLGVI